MIDQDSSTSAASNSHTTRDWFRIAFKYTAIHFLVCQLAVFLASEIVVISALRSGGTADVIARSNSIIVIAASLGSALAVYIALAKRHRNLFFRVAPVVSLASAFLNAALGEMLFPNEMAILGIQRLLNAVFWDLVMVGVAATICRLVRLPRPSTDDGR